ncbi:MAG: hypothetical protein D4Q79_01185 [Spirochaetia bacterium]|nr:MAG: hypothetical protein D4Q79_01185 [Spirochaetia bacterium]
MKKIKKRSRGRNTFVGNSGEHFVMAELLKQGIIAALAPRNSHDFDVLATDGKRSVNIRVKTKSIPSVVWQFTAKKNGNIYENIARGKDFVCLVDLKEVYDNPDYYIVPTQKINNAVKNDFNRWLLKPDRHGKKHDKTKTHRIFGQEEYHQQMLGKIKGNWSILKLKSFR